MKNTDYEARKQKESFYISQSKKRFSSTFSIFPSSPITLYRNDELSKEEMNQNEPYEQGEIIDIHNQSNYNINPTDHDKKYYNMKSYQKEDDEIGPVPSKDFNPKKQRFRKDNHNEELANQGYIMSGDRNKHNRKIVLTAEEKRSQHKRDKIIKEIKIMDELKELVEKNALKFDFVFVLLNRKS